MNERLRNFFRPTNIYESQRPMLWTLNYLGLFPFKITGSRTSKRLTVSLIFSILSVVFFIFFFSCCAILLIDENGAELITIARTSFITRFASIIKFFNLTGLMFLIYGSCLCLSKRIRCCMERIIKIDRKLSRIGVEIDYRKSFYFSISLICFVILHITSSFVLSLWTNEIQIKEKPHLKFVVWISFFTQHVTLVIVSVVACYQASIASEINTRFEAMNRVSFIFFLTFCALAPKCFETDAHWL